MRKRSAEIVQAILRNGKKGLYVKGLVKKYKISQKTLRNDIKEINQFLQDISASELIFTEKGEIVRGPDFDEALVERCLYEMDPYTYKLSTKERQIYIMMILITSEQYITMQSFAEELYVSRSTIVNDIEAIKEEYRKTGVELVVDPGKGMILDCEKRERVENLIALYKEIEINVKNDGFFQRMIGCTRNLSSPVSSPVCRNICKCAAWFLWRTFFTSWFSMYLWCLTFGVRLVLR